MRAFFVLFVLAFHIASYCQLKAPSLLPDLRKPSVVVRLDIEVYDVEDEDDYFLLKKESYKINTSGLIVKKTKYGDEGIGVDSLIYDVHGNLTERFILNNSVMYTTRKTDHWVYNLKNELVRHYQYGDDHMVSSSLTLVTNTPSEKTYDRVCKSTHFIINDYYSNLGDFIAKKLQHSDSLTFKEKHLYDQDKNEISVKVYYEDSTLREDSYTYNNLGQKIQDNFHDLDGNINWTIYYDYDTRGNKVRARSQNIAIDSTITNESMYMYDMNNNLIYSKSTGSSTMKCSYRYDSNGNWIERSIYRGGKKNSFSTRAIHYR